MRHFDRQQSFLLWFQIEPQLIKLSEHENAINNKGNNKSLNLNYQDFMFQTPIPKCFEQMTCNGMVCVMWSYEFCYFIYRFLDIASTDNAKDANMIMEYVFTNFFLIDGRGKSDELMKRLKTMACSYYIIKNEDDSIKRILHLDLARLIQPNKDENNRPEFTGGLLHVLKHFSFEGKNLTYGNDVNDVFDIYHIAYMIGSAFGGALTKKVDNKGRGSYETDLVWSNGKNYHFSFYKEEESEVYFLNTVFIDE